MTNDSYEVKSGSTPCSTKEDTQELMPCPFCGQKPDPIKSEGFLSAECTFCGVSVFADIWQMRHTPDIEQAIDELKDRISFLKGLCDDHLKDKRAYDVVKTTAEIEGLESALKTLEKLKGGK